MKSILFLHVLIVATCGLIYELLAGTVASYLLGDSITQFSLVIGIYLSAMGVGAWASRRLEAVAKHFVEVELAVALLGGASAPIFFFAFGHPAIFSIVLYTVVFCIGVLVGLELPLLLRILQNRVEFKDLISRALSFDYIGALVASLLFPLVLVPRLGLVRTSLLFGLINAGVALWATYLLRPLLVRGVSGLRVRAWLVIALLAAGAVNADKITSLAEDNLFADEIVYSHSSPYQRIVITRGRAGFQLFLNGNLQFSSADEYRYHESLVHPAMTLDGAPRRVLVLGGGDGLALREILKYPSVAEVTLVDLDPAMTGLSRAFPSLGELNNHSFSDKRVHVINGDAMRWLTENPREIFDVAIVDFPDPNNFALGKLYTTRFYRLLKSHIAPDGVVTVQTTSPLFARNSYWCIIRTMEAAGFVVRPYHVAVPSFGEWGFALAKLTPFEPPSILDAQLRFLDSATMASLFVFPRDLMAVPVKINRLDNQILVRYYESEWRHWD